MSKHTPGPWRTYLDANGDQHIVDSNANPDHLLVVSCGPPSNKYSEANAKLIAAAPDLLNHLKSLLWLAGDEGVTVWHKDQIIEVKELIRKLC